MAKATSATVLTGTLDPDAGEAGPVPGTVVVRSQHEFGRLAATGRDRTAYEEALARTLPTDATWQLPIYCEACRQVSLAAGSWHYSNGVVPNFRETLICPSCHLNNRQRFMAALLAAQIPETPRLLPIYLYEQVTPMVSWAAEHPGREAIGSEYLGYEFIGGTVIDGIRHEDALALSFDTASLAAIVSTDVFEHVPDIDEALREAARVLAPGGRLFFSIPFHADRYEIVRRAQVVGSEIQHLLPAQYHGNPVSEDGSLVFYDHGWEFLDRCIAAGFDDAYGICYWNPMAGYLGGGLQLTFVASRSGPGH